MSAPYIPPTDAALDAWAINYATLLSGDPTRYGVTAAEALVVQNDSDAYTAALALATNPTTRSPTTVDDKDAIRSTMLADVRALAALIRANAGVSNADKTALGLTVPDTVRTSVPVPTSVPNLDIIGASPSLHTIKYQDSVIATGKLKPYGVVGAVLYRFIGVAPLATFDELTCPFVGLFTKSPMPVAVPDGVTGKIATYFARWTTKGAKNSGGFGQLGPLNSPSSFVCPMLNPFAILLVLPAAAIAGIMFGLRFLGQRGKRGVIRSRRGIDPSKKPSGTQLTVTAAHFTTPNLVVVFDAPYVLAGIPQYLTDTGKLPDSVAVVDATSITLAYTTPGSVTAVVVPQNDAAVHSRTGGSVAPGTFLAD